MAVEIQVPKLAKVYIGGSLLGYTRNGCEIEAVPHMIPVPGDEHGGDDGPPIDYQHLPTLYRIHLSLTKFEKSILEAIEASITGGTAGTFATNDIGVTYIGGSKIYRVTIVTTTSSWVRNFPLCIPTAPPAYNLGTRFMEATVEFMALRNQSSGIVWDQTGI